MTRGRTVAPTTDELDGRLVLGGERVDGEGMVPVRDPFRGDSVGSVHTAAARHVEVAVERAREGAGQMARMPVHERVAILRRASALIADRAGLIAATVSRQTGKALKDTLREATRATFTLGAAAAAAEMETGEVPQADAIPGGEGLVAMVIREPLGVLAAIAPFNAPFNLSMHKVAAALAAGNSVVLKPSSYAPFTALQLADIMLEAGLPPSAISVLPGGDVGAALVAHPGVDAVSFTGGVPAGRKIAASAGLKPVVLELGGNSPNIVHRDADLGWAASALVAGGFSNTGQSCNSVQRIYAHAAIVDELLDRLVTLTGSLRVDDPMDEMTDVGTLVDESAARRVEDWVQEAVSAGARIATGARREGAQYWPTILTDVRPAMKVCSLEIFGPVVGILPYADLEEALLAANDSPFGLQSAIFTRSLEVAFTVARGIESGGIMVNRSSNTRLDNLPFGGVKDSGMGREGGRYSLAEMTRRKLILIDPSMSGSPHPLARP